MMEKGGVNGLCSSSPESSHRRDGLQVRLNSELGRTSQPKKAKKRNFSRAASCGKDLRLR